MAHFKTNSSNQNAIYQSIYLDVKSRTFCAESQLWCFCLSNPHAGILGFWGILPFTGVPCYCNPLSSGTVLQRGGRSYLLHAIAENLPWLGMFHPFHHCTHLTILHLIPTGNLWHCQKTHVFVLLSYFQKHIWILPSQCICACTR